MVINESIPACHTEHQANKDCAFEDQVEDDALNLAPSIAEPVLEQSTAVKLEGVQEERKNLKKNKFLFKRVLIALCK
jgi:hypothetical protein